MRINGSKRLLCGGNGRGRQALVNAKGFRTDNKEAVLQDVVIDFTYGAGRGVLNGNYAKISIALSDG